VKRSFKKSFLIVLTFFALTFSTLGAMPAYADDSTPPPTAEDVAQPPVDELAEAEEIDVADETVATEKTSSEETVAEEPAEAEETATADETVVTEEPAVEETTPLEEVAGTGKKAATVAEVLEHLPEDTELVVLGEGGETLPLATEEAARALAAPDPYFWVGGILYEFTSMDCDPGTASDQPCATPIQAAIDYLVGLDATPDDNTVYVEAGTYNEDVEINGSWWTSLGDLYLWGDGSGSTTVNGRFWAHNLTNSLGLDGFTFTDIVVIDTDDDVFLYDVVVDGATNSGIDIESSGRVDLWNVESYQNNSDGARVEADGDITVFGSIFEDNSSTGLYAQSTSGTITLAEVIASSNGNYGADIWATGNVIILNSTFEDNTSTGLGVTSGTGYPGNGNIILYGVTAIDNGFSGAALLSDGGSILVWDSTFEGNTERGLYANSFSGSVTLYGVTVSDNGGAGAYLRSRAWVDVFCSDFSSNDTGVIGYTPDLYLSGVTFSGNTRGDYGNEAGNVWINDYPCGGEAVGDKSEKLPPVLYIVIPQTQAQLPGVLGDGFTFGSAFKVELTERGRNISNLTFTLSFPIPASMKDAKLAVMFWNGSAWVEVPGGNVVGDYFVITVGQPGYYVLVSK
jgi:hypothetical protein